MFFTTCCASPGPVTAGEESVDGHRAHVSESNDGFESAGVLGVGGEEVADWNRPVGRWTPGSAVHEDGGAKDKDLITPLHQAASKGTAADVRKCLAEDGADVRGTNEDGETPLHRAVYWGNVEAVAPLLEARSDVHAMDRKKKTPIRKAYDNHAICEMLLAAGADPDSKDKHGDATLHRATEDGCADVVRVLLDARAKPELNNSDGQTALHQAAEGGHLEVARLLLAARAPADAKSADGDTPLACAESAGHRDVVELLRASGG